MPTLAVRKATVRDNSKKRPEMTRLILVLTLCGLAACTTYKLWTQAGESEEEGVVSLSYEYRRFESPQVDERAGLNMARDRCKDWGYRDAQRKGEDRQCKDGTQSDCSRWVVIREYRCLDGPKK
jgi:hypothetical protein